MKARNITGKKFGLLTAISRDKQPGGRTNWIFLCECGNRKSIYITSVLRGLTKSCGCIRKKSMSNIGKSNLKHGLWNHPLYNIFMKMKYRCENPKCHAYRWYGARGIKVLFKSPEHFIKWAEENGYKKGLSIERVDNDGNYSPENCTWIPLSEQHKNTSRGSHGNHVD